MNRFSNDRRTAYVRAGLPQRGLRGAGGGTDCHATRESAATTCCMQRQRATNKRSGRRGAARLSSVFLSVDATLATGHAPSTARQVPQEAVQLHCTALSQQRAGTAGRPDGLVARTPFAAVHGSLSLPAGWLIGRPRGIIALPRTYVDVDVWCGGDRQGGRIICRQGQTGW